jgi:hypothetical protein
MKTTWCELSEVADVALGFKSLQNHFYYLSDQTINLFKIEKEYLRPILRLKDLSSKCFLQNAVPSEYFFHCADSLPELKGTGALQYIRAMENQPAQQKKQSGVPKSVSQVLKAQSGTHWYSPKATLHEEHIWVRKAFGSVYSPFLFKNRIVVDQRCNRIHPKGKQPWELIAALLSSSLFSLSVESAGASSLGAGALEVATTMLRQIRVPDIRLLTEKDKLTLIELALEVWKKSRPTDWDKLDQPDKYVCKLDSWLLYKMKAPFKQEKLYKDIKSTYEIRKILAKDKTSTSKQSELDNVDSVAKTIETAVRPILEGRRFPESFFPAKGEIYTFDFSGYSKLIVRCEPFISNSSVSIINPISGETIFEKEYPRPVADLVLRSLMTARRKFDIPKSQAVAISVRDDFLKWISSIFERIKQGCRDSALGTRFESRLYEAMIKRLGLHNSLGDDELFGEFIVDHNLKDTF